MAHLAERLADRYGEFLHRRRRWIMCAAALLALLCLPPSIRILSQLDTNILNQVSERLPRFRALRDASEEFGGDVLAAVVIAPESNAKNQETREQICRYGDLLAAQLARVGLEPEDQQAYAKAFKASDPNPPQQPWLDGVECRLGSAYEKNIAGLLRQYPQVTFDEADLNELKQRFEPAALQERLRQIRAEVAALDPLSLERQRLAADPLKMAELAGQSMQRHFRTQGQTLPASRDGYLLSADGTTLLVIARPARSSRNMTFNRLLMEACHRAVLRAAAEFRPGGEIEPLRDDAKINHFASGTRFQTGFTGLHAMAVENEHALRWDIIWGALTSTLSVLIILYVVLRSVRLTWNIALALGLSALVTLAIVWLIHGPVGVMAAGFTSILAGMGSDYGIVLYGNYYELRMSAGLPPAEAIRQTLRRKAPALLICSFTTAVGFLGVAFLDFRALAELGLVAGIAMLVSSVVMILFFPALLLSCDCRKTGRMPRAMTLGLGSFGKFLSSRTGRICGISAGAALVALCAGLLLTPPAPQPGMERVLGVRFDPDLGNLRSLHSLTAALRDWVVKKFDGGLVDIRVITEGENEEQALAAAEAVQQRAAPFIARNEIKSSQSLVTMLPGLTNQAERLRALKTLDIKDCRERFKAAALAEFGAKGESFFEPFFSRLDETAQTIQNARELRLAGLRSGLNSPLLDRFVRAEPSGRVKLMTYLLPAQLMYSEEWCRQLASAMESQPAPGGGTIFLTAGRFVGYELKQSVVHDMLWIFAIVAAQVFVVILLPLRSFMKTVLIMLPVGCAVLFVLGGISVAERTAWGLSLNFMNIMIFPILMGSAEDYGTYMVLEIYAGRRPPLSEVLNETGRSLILCCATTLGGFGTMIFGSNSGLVSFGWTAILGYLGALFCALFLIPALMSCMGMGREREPERETASAALAPVLEEVPR